MENFHILIIPHLVLIFNTFFVEKGSFFMNNEINVGGLLALPYQRDRAVEYARRWAFGRNPLFADFAGVGGDCTNFVSQAVLAGSCVVDRTPTFGWYFNSPDDRAPAWTGVDEFFGFITGEGDYPPPISRPGPFGWVAAREYVSAGDVVQLANAAGEFYHTLMITKVSPDGEIFVTGHTNDVLDRPLSSYPNTSERFLRILGVLAPDGSAPPNCFQELINGRKDNV